MISFIFFSSSSFLRLLLHRYHFLRLRFDLSLITDYYIEFRRRLCHFFIFITLLIIAFISRHIEFHFIDITMS